MFMALGTFETFTLEYGRTLGSTCALWSTFKAFVGIVWAHGGRWLPYLDLDLRGVRGRRIGMGFLNLACSNSTGTRTTLVLAAE
jgi:hypothetical protein